MGDRIAILREGGVLAQYDTPDAILAHPADDFVAQFVGEDRALRRLALRRLGDIELDPVGNPGSPPHVPVVGTATTVRNAVSLHARERHRPRARRGRRRDAASASSGSSGSQEHAAVIAGRRPRDPELRQGQLVRDGRPLLLLGLGAGALGRHARAGARAPHRADADRGRDRLRARVRPGAARPPRRRARAARSASSPRCSTRSRASRCSSSSCPFTGITTTTIEIALVAYTLVILFPNIIAGLRCGATGGARGGARDGPTRTPDADAGRAAARGADDHRRAADRRRLDDLDRHDRRVPRRPRASATRSSTRSSCRRRSRPRSTPPAPSPSRWRSPATRRSCCSAACSCPGRRAGGDAIALLDTANARTFVEAFQFIADNPGFLLTKAVEQLELVGRGARDRARDRAAAGRAARPPAPRLRLRDRLVDRRPRAAEPRADRRPPDRARDRVRRTTWSRSPCSRRGRS